MCGLQCCSEDRAEGFRCVNRERRRDPEGLVWLKELLWVVSPVIGAD